MPGSSANIAPVLSLRSVSKRFGGVSALRDVDLDVAQGEVHGLLGHNGSGKSTLIKVLSGFHAPELGAAMALNGRTVNLPLAAGEFREQGIAFVHQDLGILESLSVVENLRLGKIAATGSWHLNWRRESREVTVLLEEFGVDADPWADVAELPPWQRPLLAIVRAVDDMRAAILAEPDRRGLLVLDEPTANLSETGIDKLFAVVRQVAAGGHGVLFVSHDLDEVVELTDRITVLRDGEVAGSANTAEITHEHLVELIVGQPLQTKDAPVRRPNGEIRVLVECLSGEAVDAVDLCVHAGEIAGITGLVGSGYEQVGPLLFGAVAGSGRVTIDGHHAAVESMSPHRAMAIGIGLVPGERLREGCVSSLSASDNVTVPVLRRFQRFGRLDLGALRGHTRQLMTRLAARPDDPDLPIEAFSGGNQQKVLLAKWLQLEPALLVLIEPTQGVDVGARAAILDLIRDCAADGMAILCASADHEQLAQLCDRVLVMRRGRLIGDLSGSALTKDRISLECFRDTTSSDEHGDTIVTKTGA